MSTPIVPEDLVEAVGGDFSVRHRTVVGSVRLFPAGIVRWRRRVLRAFGFRGRDTCAVDRR